MYVYMYVLIIYLYICSSVCTVCILQINIKEVSYIDMYFHKLIPIIIIYAVECTFRKEHVCTVCLSSAWLASRGPKPILVDKL